MIRNVVLLGGGCSGLIAALTLKTRLPQLAVTIVRSPEIDVLGLEEGSRPDLLDHLHGECAIDPARFHEEVRPTYKLGNRFHWGSREVFNYPFSNQTTGREGQIPKPRGYYAWVDFQDADPYSALMSRGRLFSRQQDGSPNIQKCVGYHFENARLLASLELTAQERGIVFRDGTVRDVEVESSESGNDRFVTGLILADGETIHGDFFIDASGFRSLLLGHAMGDPFMSYRDSLSCDRILASGWDRSTEVINPYTTIKTLSAGWSWQIEAEDRIKCGYVFNSAFLSDSEAETEFRKQFPKADESGIIRFASGRHVHQWSGNVVAVGTASGFVEPLASTGLTITCQQSRLLARILADCELSPTPSLAASYNRIIGRNWDETRDFLALHYRYNFRMETPFWSATRAESALHDAERIVQFYQENGPSTILGHDLLPSPQSTFQLEGYYTMLLGQKIPFHQPREISGQEWANWSELRRQNAAIATKGLTVRETLDFVRQPGWKWTSGFYQANSN